MSYRTRFYNSQKLKQLIVSGLSVIMLDLQMLREQERLPMLKMR